MISAQFGKERRLLDKSSYDRVFANPKKVKMGSFLLLARPSEQNSSRLGLAISKKRVPHATDRNRIKRHFRESFRHADLPAIDIVAISGHGLGQLSNLELRKKLNEAWKKIEVLCAS